MFNSDEPGGLSDGGTKLPLAPDGNPFTARLTELLNPFVVPTVVVKFVLPPAVIVRLDGVVVSVKSGNNVKESAAEWVMLPLVAVIVIG